MSEPTDAPAADGPLSVDAAIELLVPTEAGADTQPGETVDTVAEEIEQPADAQAAHGDDPPETEPVEPEGETSDPEPQASAIAAPESWDAEARAKFATLPADLQQLVADRDAEAKRATSRAMTEASEAKKRAETEASGIAQYKAALDQLIPNAQRTFADKWADVDWVRWASEDPAAAQIGRFQFEQEQGELARLKAVHQQTEQVQFAKFLEAEEGRLKEIAPQLADPKEGPAKRKAVAEYLTSQGIQSEALRGVSAVEMSIAHKAMLWDQAQAAAKAPKPAATAKPAPAPARPTVKPAAAQPGSSPQRNAFQAQNRFAQTRSVDDAVALLLAKKA